MKQLLLLVVVIMFGCSSGSTSSGGWSAYEDTNLDTVYKYLYRTNAYQLNGRTIRWPDKPIKIYVENNEWKEGITRWPVSFKFVDSRPSVGVTVQYGDTIGVCGSAEWNFNNTGELQTCKVMISTMHDVMHCYSEQFTVTHEIGHCLGHFEHSDNGSIMDRSSASVRIEPLQRFLDVLYGSPPGTDINGLL